MEIAVKNNPGVQQKFAEYKAALEKVPQVGSLPDPELSIGVFLSPMELVNGKQVSDIRLMQMFPWFGVLRNGKDEMSLMAKSKFESYHDTKLQLLFDVSRTWYELYRTQKQIEYSGKNLELLNTIESLSVEKLRTGISTGSSNNSVTNAPSTAASTGTGSMGMKSSVSNMNASQPAAQMNQGLMNKDGSNSVLADVNRIKIESNDLKYNIYRLNNQLQTLSVTFNNLLNRSSQTKVFLPDSLATDTLKLSFYAILDSLRAANPMLSMVSLEKQSVEARKKMVSRMGFPMIGFGLNYSLIKRTDIPMEPSMNGKDMLMPMMTVTLPVYRKKYNAMKNEAAFLESAAENNISSVTNQLENEYYQAVQAYEDAKRRVELFSGQLKLVSSTLEIQLKNFSSSTASLTDVLRASQQKYDYELKSIEAVTDLNIATASLRRLGALNMGIKQ
jgi:outer membrane protein TolC